MRLPLPRDRDMFKCMSTGVYFAHTLPNQGAQNTIERGQA
jgi:hypothetical protein